MKHFKTAFAAVVAIVTMSFIIAERQGAFKIKKLFPVGTCDANSFLKVTYFNSGCSGTTSIAEEDVSACTDLTGKFISSLNTPNPVPFDCDGTQTKICCLRIATNQLCADGLTRKDKISDILCYPGE